MTALSAVSRVMSWRTARPTLPRPIRAALWYNALVFCAFAWVYLSLDFRRHFHTASRPTLASKLYYAIMNHTAIGCNDITPKTDAARKLVAAHSALAWFQVVLVFAAK